MTLRILFALLLACRLCADPTHSALLVRASDAAILERVNGSSTVSIGTPQSQGSVVVIPWDGSPSVDSSFPTTMTTDPWVPLARYSAGRVLPRTLASVRAEYALRRRARALRRLGQARSKLDGLNAELVNDPTNNELRAARDAAQAELERIRQEAR